MESVLLKAIAFVVIIVLGYVLKKIGVFKPTDYRILSKVVFNLTLPAAVITSFASFDLDIALLYLIPIGLACNLALSGIGYLSMRKKDRETKAFFMLNTSGFNIGCFMLPYVQNILGPYGVVVACMFDTGNSIMCTGATYALVQNVASGKKKHVLKNTLKSMFTSVPLDVYLLMTVLVILGIRPPEGIVSVTSVIGEANGFCSMLMIGMMFEINIEKQYLKDAVLILVIRFVFAAGLACLFYYCLPFSQTVREIMVILAFAPMAVLNTIFTEKLKGNVAVASMVNSLSIVISLVIVTSMVSTMRFLT